MRHTDGADIPQAIRHWREAGFSVRELADSLNIAASTVYRWARGQYRPNVANFAALREEIDMRYATENARHNLTVVGAQLASAFAALETDADRAEDEELAAKLTASFAAREAQREAEQAERNARAAAARDEVVPAQRRSAFADTDPFKIFGQPEPALPF